MLFSMATSSAEFMPRNADFLFSKNRLNVAVSRCPLPCLPGVYRPSCSIRGHETLSK